MCVRVCVRVCAQCVVCVGWGMTGDNVHGLANSRGEQGRRPDRMRSQRGGCGVDDLSPVAHGWDVGGADGGWRKRMKEEKEEDTY